MAELLVKAQSFNTGDPLAYQVGDPVVVRPDNHAWGSLETIPDFWKLRITDRTVEQIQTYLISVTDLEGNVTLRKKYRVTLDGMDPVKRDLMFAGGIPQFTWTQLRKQVLDKQTGLTA